ncbi:MAG: amidohydrolase family protein, partial [Acidobacteria bacterium]|nr:amidohydrolase family protein [Acidobacteriota bacterium]
MQGTGAFASDRFCMFSLIILSLATSCSQEDPPSLSSSMMADMVLINGKIITMDPDQPRAGGLAVKDGRIIAVGDGDWIEALAGPQTIRVDLRGSTATPGLIDSHNHFAIGATDGLYSLNLRYPEVMSIVDVVEAVQIAARDRPPGEWIQGGGWDEGKLAEKRLILTRDLDPVSPDHPVWLLNTTAHFGTANTEALRRAGITAGTKDPTGGRIERDAAGNPTGVLKDQAMDLMWAVIPEFTPDQLENGIEKVVRELNAAGVTAVKDPEIDRSIWDAYQQVHARGGLSVRVFTLWRAPDTVEGARELLERIGPFSRPTITTGDDRLISGGVKIYVDGSGGARTAWVHDTWNKNYRELDDENHGFPVVDPEVLGEQVRLFHSAGIHVGLHAIGDRAIDWAVDTYHTVLTETPIRGLRHSIIHCNIPTAHALDRMAELQATHDAGYPEIQPSFMWWIGDTYAGNFGPERSRRVHPLKTYLERGIRWGGGSDYDVTPFPPRYGLWAAMTRTTLLGTHGSQPFGDDEAIGILEALRAYTVWNARQLFLEDKIGSIETGKYADIVIWDVDLDSAPTEAIKNMRALLTLVNGEIVHRSPGDALFIDVPRVDPEPPAGP